jgi:hypothetical protein
MAAFFWPANEDMDVFRGAANSAVSYLLVPEIRDVA